MKILLVILLFEIEGHMHCQELLQHCCMQKMEDSHSIIETQNSMHVVLCPNYYRGHSNLHLHYIDKHLIRNN